MPAKAIMTLERFEQRKLSLEDAVSVPTHLPAQRRFLEEKFRSQLGTERLEGGA